jgi:hypothetical protein
MTFTRSPQRPRARRCTFLPTRLIGVFIALSSAVIAFSQTGAPDVSKKLEDLDKAVKSAQMSGCSL